MGLLNLFFFVVDRKDENVIRFPENENLSPAYVAKKVVNGKKTRVR
jgi:hypothetical protein